MTRLTDTWRPTAVELERIKEWALVVFVWLLLRGRVAVPFIGVGAITASFFSRPAAVALWALASVILAFHLGLLCGETGLRSNARLRPPKKESP